MEHTPAEILAQYLNDQDALGSYNYYIDHMPATPFNCVCFYDIVGVKDGRLMETGEEIIHHQVMCLLRCISYEAGWAIMSGLLTECMSIAGEEVTIDDYFVYSLDNVSLVNTIQARGQDDTRRLETFEASFKITLTEL